MGVHRRGGGARRGDERGCVVNTKSFFVASLSSALELGIATPNDVLRHVTSDVLAAHLPRPLWARLLTAALGAPQVDAQLVVETIGVPNLCEHVPATIIWACLAEIAQRALSGATLPGHPQPIPLGAPPPEIQRTMTPARGTSVGPSIPKPMDVADVVASLESEERPTATDRLRTTSRFRQSSPGISRLTANNARRPQAVVEVPPAPARPARRGETEADAYDVETDLKDDWKNTIAVEDDQLVEWKASTEET